MHCCTLPFRSLPHQPKLFLDFLDDHSRVSRFFPHSASLESAIDAGRTLNYPVERRSALIKILRDQNSVFGCGAVTRENLSRLENGAVAIVTGQQVGLLSGPAYAIYKAVSAIQIAREITGAGLPAVPVFWMASEDHDLEEVRHTTFFQDGQLHRFELPVSAATGAPVGQIRLGESVDGIVKAATIMLPGEDGGKLAGWLRETYRPEETYASAFGKLFARLFADQGLILIDPQDPRVHRLAAPVYLRGVENRDALNDELLNRGKELESEGYAAQVKVTGRSSLLFFTGGGQRLPITASEKRFRSGEMTWSTADLAARIKGEPEKFSSNALLRPVVQDYLLPTAAFIAGPNEITYLAQSEVLYREILGRMPAIFPRSGFTLVDPKGQRLLAEYGLHVQEVWEGPQVVKAHLHGANLPKPLAKQFEKDAKTVGRILERWKASLKKVDPTLEPTIESSKHKIAFQMEKLREKAGNALDRKRGVLAAHEEFLNNLLYPRKALQSRELNLLPLLARWGLAGLRELEEHSSSKSIGKHFVVPIP